ncbi:hypothetical protein VM1G_09021 [Cytospora mali]|uniref:Uncharacterized protein n=1 Tax=Cytospora mali TaxID=578113 RepID=A0A194W9I6_CYTMA|nr:hypothetical protein VM1G_09021 [Valsa mali]
MVSGQDTARRSGGLPAQGLVPLPAARHRRAPPSPPRTSPRAHRPPRGIGLRPQRRCLIPGHLSSQAQSSPSRRTSDRLGLGVAPPRAWDRSSWRRVGSTC